MKKRMVTKRIAIGMLSAAMTFSMAVPAFAGTVLSGEGYTTAITKNGQAVEDTDVTAAKIYDYFNNEKVEGFNPAPKAKTDLLAQGLPIKSVKNIAVTGGASTGWVSDIRITLEDGTVYVIRIQSGEAKSDEDKSNETGKAEAAAKEANSVYVLMNIPYDQFYKAVGSDGVDAIASATSKVRNSGTAGSSYYGTGAVNEEDAATASTALGVQFPVKADKSVLNSYTEVKDSDSAMVYYSIHGQTRSSNYSGKATLIYRPAYAYYSLTETPENYLEFDGKNFTSKITDVTTVDGSDTEFEYNGHHSDIGFDVADQVKDSSDIFAGVTVDTSAGTYNLRTTDQIWRGQELGWNLKDDFAKTNGATVNSYTVYKSDGSVYKVNVNRQLKKIVSSDVEAELKDAAGTVSNLPEDIENPAVTVYSSSANAQGRTVLTPVAGLENVKIGNDGKFDIPYVALTEGTEYTVTVSSDNYADLSTKATYTKTPLENNNGSSKNSAAPIAPTFPDVSDTGDLRTAVLWGVRNNVTVGYADGTFKPDQDVTRAEFVTFLYRLEGSPDTDETVTNDFTDCGSLKGSDFAKAVSWAVSNKIAYGYGDGTFRPESTVTRAEALAFLHRYEGNKSAAGEASFSDVNQSAWYAKDVNWAYANNIAAGRGNNTFGVDYATKRGEAMQFIYRAAK